MRKILAAFAAVLAGWHVVQLFLAGSGAVAPGPVSESFADHQVSGHMMIALAIVVVAVSALARVPGRVTGLAALILLLLLTQLLLSTVSDAVGGGTESPLVFGVHAIVGVVSAGLSTLFLVLSVRHARTPVKAPETISP